MFSNLASRFFAPVCLPSVFPSANPELAELEARWNATVYVAREVLALVAVALIGCGAHALIG